MDIPPAGRWILLALAAIQLVYAVRALRPALRSRPGRRVDPWLAFGDHAAGVAVSLALASGNVTAFLVAMAVLGPLLAARLVRSAAARREKPTPA
ncbi:hypothetical protein [Streptomyces sp. NPDC051109]|uniref:hypothetical protein n=1 Tax=Streptomyces sp. NPDC051109 TaxID=3365642 RepID=UPI00106550DD